MTDSRSSHPSTASRVRVTSPRTSAPRAQRVTPVAEIDRRSALGEVYVTSLLRAQLRLGVGVLALAVGGLAALPVVFELVPALAVARVAGMPVAWALLGFLAYPFLFGCGWLYVRGAERNERAFQAMVEPGPRPDGPGANEAP